MNNYSSQLQTNQIYGLKSGTTVVIACALVTKSNGRKKRRRRQ